MCGLLQGGRTDGHLVDLAFVNEFDTIGTSADILQPTDGPVFAVMIMMLNW